MTSHQDKAIVLFSGGQDSTLCLFWALQRYAHVETIGFNYGQRHHVELTARKIILSKLREIFPNESRKLREDHLCDLSTLGLISQTALTSKTQIEISASGLPTTFVPGRNLIFLNFAAAIAWRRGIDVLVGGMCETDYSGYPDCRRATLDAQAEALRLGMERDFHIETPLMHLDKAETWALAETLGGPRLTHLIIEHSHTCYLGDRSTRHDWGYGCGACPACDLRAKGWQKWQSASPT